MLVCVCSVLRGIYIPIPQTPRASYNIEHVRVIVLMNARGHPSGAANQAQVLRGEGVTVSTGSMGELMVDLVEYGCKYFMEKKKGAYSFNCHPKSLRTREMLT